MFELASQIERGSEFVADLPLSQLRLLNDKRFPWLLLIPRRAGVAELIDLQEEDAVQLMHEIRQVSGILRKDVACDKINVAALGNKVRQLHVHIIARIETDAAWPGAVWDKGEAIPYHPDALQSHLAALRSAV